MKGRDPHTGGSRRSNGIFISYRRGDSDGQAHALRDRLTLEYGRSNVFMDVDSIVPGTDFVRQIENELASTEVMLVLIGTHWQEVHGGRGRLSDPEDFVRLEVAAALRRNIPTIPVLIEAASLPRPDELPELLRPLVRIQAVNLRSASWDYDISRVAGAVARYIKRDPRPRRVRPAVAAGTVVILAVVAALVWLLRPTPPARPAAEVSTAPSVRHSPPVPHPPPVASLTATAAVAAVQPERLIEKLLDTPFAAGDVPDGTSAAAPALSEALTSLTSGSNGAEAAGLAATIYVPFSGLGTTAVDYYVFGDDYHANSYFARIVPFPPGYTSAGLFSHATIGDSTKCQRATAGSQRTIWGCVTVSANVVSYSAVIENAPGDGASAESALARDAVHHLQATAVTQPQAPFPQPPGPSLNPAGLFGQVQSPFPAALTPSGLSQPQTTSVPLASSVAPGLEAGHAIKIIFAGSGQSYSSGSYISIEVFDNTSDAQSHYNNTRLIPSNGLTVTQTYYEPYAPSGFSTTQQALCRTYAVSAGPGGAASGFSVCQVQWGDVVVFGTTTYYGTQAVPQPQSADNNMAITLATSGLVFVGQLLAG